jgi:hypothetical protein
MFGLPNEGKDDPTKVAKTPNRNFEQNPKIKHFEILGKSSPFICCEHTGLFFIYMVLSPVFNEQAGIYTPFKFLGIPLRLGYGWLQQSWSMTRRCHTLCDRKICYLFLKTGQDLNSGPLDMIQRLCTKPQL